MNQPVVVAGAGVTGVIVVVKAFIELAVVMDWFGLTPEEWAAWAIFLETTIPIAAVWVSAWYVSRNTTNLAEPRDTDGEPLTRADNTPAIKELAKIHGEAIEMNKEQSRGITNG